MKNKETKKSAQVYADCEMYEDFTEKQKAA